MIEQMHLGADGLQLFSNRELSNLFKLDSSHVVYATASDIYACFMFGDRVARKSVLAPAQSCYYCKFLSGSSFFFVLWCHLALSGGAVATS